MVVEVLVAVCCRSRFPGIKDTTTAKSGNSNLKRPFVIKKSIGPNKMTLRLERELGTFVDASFTAFGSFILRAKP